MVQYAQALDSSFAALADPTRRGVLRRLGHADASISELASSFGMTLTGMKKHVRILEGAGLVATRKVGRVRQCALGSRRLDDAARWIDEYRALWDARLDRFGSALAKRRSR
jgi:DNA-binding transcriptional ArsR family regulator